MLRQRLKPYPRTRRLVGLELPLEQALLQKQLKPSGPYAVSEGERGANAGNAVTIGAFAMALGLRILCHALTPSMAQCHPQAMGKGTEKVMKLTGVWCLLLLHERAMEGTCQRKQLAHRVTVLQTLTAMMTLTARAQAVSQTRKPLSSDLSDVGWNRKRSPWLYR